VAILSVTGILEKWNFGMLGVTALKPKS